MVRVRDQANERERRPRSEGGTADIRMKVQKKKSDPGKDQTV